MTLLQRGTDRGDSLPASSPTSNLSRAARRPALVGAYCHDKPWQAKRHPEERVGHYEDRAGRQPSGACDRPGPAGSDNDEPCRHHDQHSNYTGGDNNGLHRKFRQPEHGEWQQKQVDPVPFVAQAAPRCWQVRTSAPRSTSEPLAAHPPFETFEVSNDEGCRHVLIVTRQGDAGHQTLRASPKPTRPRWRRDVRNCGSRPARRRYGGGMAARGIRRDALFA